MEWKMPETLLEEVRRAMAEADCLATPAVVDQAYDRLAEEITARLQHANPLIFTVMNGGLIVAGRLIAKLNFPLETRLSPCHSLWPRTERHPARLARAAHARPDRAYRADH
jgi:hypothetical protein